MNVTTPYATSTRPAPPLPPRSAGPAPSGAGSPAPDIAEPNDLALVTRRDLAAADVSEESEKTTVLERVGTTAILVAGAVSGLAGAVMPAVTALAGPTTSISAPVATPSQATAATASDGAGSGQASTEVHVISHMDATESIIEPFATDGLGQMQQATKNGAGHVTADIAIDREAHPWQKIGTGAALTGVVAAPFFIGRHFAKKHGDKALLAIGITLAGAYGSVQAAGMLNYMHDGLGSIISGVADLKHSEGVWSGGRQIHMADGNRESEATTSSMQGDPEAITRYLADNMKKYPSGTTVVHMMGHGLMYRHVSGLPGTQFENVLANATKEAGRPVDVLVLESCLVGNFETLNANYPSARYAVVSEESIAAGATGRMFESTFKATAGQELTPRQLAQSLLDHARGDKGIETLAVIDMAQMPQLSQAVDHLGASLTAEVNAGRMDVLATAVKETPVYPQAEAGATAKMLAVGDLKIFAEKLLAAYGEGGAGAASPNAEAIRTQAQEVLDRLHSTVVGFNATASYAQAGGISIQLPGMKMEKLEGSTVLGAKGLTSFKDAREPQGWRDFVNTMSPKLTE